MMLTVAAPPILAAVLEGGRHDANVREGSLMPRDRLRRDHVHADATDPRRGVREVTVDHGAVDAEALEDLRTAVRLDR